MTGPVIFQAEPGQSPTIIIRYRTRLIRYEGGADESFSGGSERANFGESGRG